MQSTPRVLLGLFVLVFAGTSAAFGGEATGIEAMDPEVTEELSPDMLRLSPSISWRRAVLRMAGPGGFFLKTEFEPGEVIAADLRGTSGSEPADGCYRYELRLLLPRTAQPGAPAEHVHTGLFSVESGQAVPRNATRKEPASVETGLDEKPAGAAANRPAEPLTTNVDDLLRIVDTDANGFVAIDLQEGVGQGWVFQNDEGTFQLWHPVGTGAVALKVESGDVMLGDTVAGRDVVTRGEVDMEKPMKSLLSAPKIGIGTFMPEADLHIFPPLVVVGIPPVDARTPTIRMHTFTDGPLGQSTRDWEIEANTGSFYVRDATTDTKPLVIRSSASDSSLVIADGTIDLGGDLNLPTGEVTADGLRLASSRERKTGFKQVDPEQVLVRLRDVPVSEWSFSGNDEGVRHIGPVAEEFHAAFDLAGQDPTHLSVTDVQGVALAAIKGLDHKLGAREQEVARLREEIEGLRDANAELERRLVAIEEGLRSDHSPIASPFPR
jgi:hypothetical protein